MKLCGVLMDAAFQLLSGNWKLETVFGGFCAPEITLMIGLAPAGVHDLLYRNSGLKEQFY
jgi:hypothetical protein